MAETALAGSESGKPARLGAVLGLSACASVSGGTFWTAIFFVTARRFGFSSLRNLVLAAAMGATYTLVASRTGALTRWSSARMVPRTTLVIPLVIQASAAILLMALARSDVPGLVWLIAVLGATASALLWPTVESYLTAGHHGAGMRAALGRFNVTWTASMSLPMVCAALLGADNILWTLALVPVANAGALLLLPGFPRNVPHHDPGLGQAAVGREYSFLRRSTLWLLPLSFLLVASLSPVLPYRLATVGVARNGETLAAATWMFVRCATLFCMWKLPLWHGRWDTLLVGALALLGGLALVLLGQSLAVVIAGLAGFGFGLGVIYYASIYYSMSVGHAAVEASGHFETVIGLGYFTGPLLGVAGHAAGGPGATVAFAWAAIALVAVPASWPYLQARRARRIGL